MAIEVYELGDIADVLGIPKTTVKSWTIGRPFSVRPSVRMSSGKGSSNLFSRNDLFCFAVVKALMDWDVPVPAIESFLQQRDLSSDTFWNEGEWIKIEQNPRFSYQFDVVHGNELAIVLRPEHLVVCSYAVHVKTIVDTISRDIELHQRARLDSKAVQSERGKTRRGGRGATGKRSHGRN